jgi:excisionase family DNA binding protein
MEETMTTRQAAKLLGITVRTLQRWEREGRLVPATRTASNRRRYTESQLRAFLRMVPAEAATTGSPIARRCMAASCSC